MTLTAVTRYWSLIGVLLAGVFVINWFEQRGEASVERRPLAEFPASVGKWKQLGSDRRFSEQTESVLRTTDYIWRNYEAPGGQSIDLYIGYYASQRTGATYHSPQNCMPGAGWEMKDPQRVELELSSGEKISANLYVVQNGQYRSLMIYWYQGRGRAVASEYLDKVYTVSDSVFKRRSDGAMIRLITPTGNGKESLEEIRDLAARVSESLTLFVPE